VAAAPQPTREDKQQDENNTHDDIDSEGRPRRQPLAADDEGTDRTVFGSVLHYPHGNPTRPFAEASLRHVLRQEVEHFHAKRNHQGKGNVLLLPAVNQETDRPGPIQCRKRLGGLLKYYMREAA
jgi:hypothetical protein